MSKNTFLKNKKRTKKNKFLSLQRGNVELLLFGMIFLFAVLISGYSLVSSIPLTNTSSLNSQWDYIPISSITPQQSKQTLQESNVSFFSIPKIVDGSGGATGSLPHRTGLKFNTKYVDPLIYARQFSIFSEKTSKFSDIIPRSYASSPNMATLNYIPPVGNQGDVGSCSSWTTDYELYGYYAENNGVYPFPGGADPPLGAGSQLGGFEPMYTYSQVAKDITSGSSIPDNFSILQSQGVDRRDFYPQGDYSMAKVTSDETKMAGNYKISSYRTLFATYPNGGGQTGEDDIKYAISHGDPVGIAFFVLPTFDNPDSSIPFVDNKGSREKDSQGNLEGHAVMAFAYDTNGLWIENQWGTNWGKNGTAELSWAYVQNQIEEAYTISAIIPQNPPTLPPSPIPDISPGQSPSPSPDPCSTLDLASDPVNCGVNSNNVGLFCSGSCGVGGSPGVLYQCQGKTMIAQTACTPKCIVCAGAPHADACGPDTSVCGKGSTGVSITPAPGTQCLASNGSCVVNNICRANCTSCAASDCKAGYSCCH